MVLPPWWYLGVPREDPTIDLIRDLSRLELAMLILSVVRVIKVLRSTSHEVDLVGSYIVG